MDIKIAFEKIEKELVAYKDLKGCYGEALATIAVNKERSKNYENYSKEDCIKLLDFIEKSLKRIKDRFNPPKEVCKTCEGCGKAVTRDRYGLIEDILNSPCPKCQLKEGVNIKPLKLDGPKVNIKVGTILEMDDDGRVHPPTCDCPKCRSRRYIL